MYNQIFNLDPKLVDSLEPTAEEQTVNLFDMNLYTILQNMANTLLLVLRDLTNVENYSNLQNFIKIFVVENRLLYLGIFITIVSLYIMLFWTTKKPTTPLIS